MDKACMNPVSEIGKPLNTSQKAMIARRELVAIKCEICKAKRIVHKFSYCWKNHLCNVCANREERGDFLGFSEVI